MVLNPLALTVLFAAALAILTVAIVVQLSGVVSAQAAQPGMLLGDLGGDLVGVTGGQLERGARILRVHDVAATVDALKVWQAVAEVPMPKTRTAPAIRWPDED